jgi:hypothetical protein
LLLGLSGSIRFKVKDIWLYSYEETNLYVAVGRPGDKELLVGVDRDGLDGRMVRGERLSYRTLPDVDEANVALLAAGDEHLVLGRVGERQAALVVARES